MVYNMFSVILSVAWQDRSQDILSQKDLDISAVDVAGNVPKIIHQVFDMWDEGDMSEEWMMARKSCIDLHPDYEFKVCTFMHLLCYLGVEQCDRYGTLRLLASYYRRIIRGFSVLSTITETPFSVSMRSGTSYSRNTEESTWILVMLVLLNSSKEDSVVFKLLTFLIHLPAPR